MSDQAKLTVVIPTHDRAELTTRAINSVFSRRPDLVEVAVVDDMCRDLVFLPVGERLNTRVEVNTRTDLDVERACQEECS